MFTALEMGGLKNGHVRTVSLGKRTLVCGRSRSGKTAVMEALRLAITGSADVGANGAKQSLIANGKTAWARIWGDQVLGEWSIKIGKAASKSHSLMRDGEEIEPDLVIGQVPVTVAGFWSLTGEQKWRLVGSVTECTASDSILIGKLKALGVVVDACDSLDLTAAESAAASVATSIKDLKAKIDRLNVSAEPPDLYMGRSSAEINADLADLQVEIARQEKARKGIAQREAMAKKDEADLTVLQAELQTATGTLGGLRLEYGDLLKDVDRADKLHAAYRDAEPFTPEIISEARQKGWTARTCINRIVDQVSELVDVALDLATQCDEPDAAQKLAIVASSLINAKPAIGCIGLDGPMPTHPNLREIAEICERHAVAGRDALAAKLALVDKQLSQRSSSVLTIRRSIEQIETRQQLELVEYGEICSEEQYAEMLAKRDAINAELAKAQEWEQWQRKAKEMVASVSEAREELGEWEDVDSRIRSLRKEMLAGSVDVIEQKANAYLDRMGLPRLKLSVTSTAKTSSLSLLSADGVDIAAMAGSERVMYGSALICALQDLDKATCPVLFVEAAEMDTDLLARFIDAMDLRTRGNVFIAHWAKPEMIGDSVSLVECDSKPELVGA